MENIKMIDLAVIELILQQKSDQKEIKKILTKSIGSPPMKVDHLTRFEFGMLTN